MPLVFSLLFHHPFPQPIPAAPKPLSYPPPPPSATAIRRGLGLLDPRKQLPGRERARGTGMGETGFFTAAGFKGPWGSLETDYYLFIYFADCCSRRGGGGGVKFHTPFLFLPRPPPPFAVTPSAAECPLAAPG